MVWTEGKMEKGVKMSSGSTGNGKTESVGKGRPVLALWALYTRSSFYKILLVLAGLALAEGVSFRLMCGGLEQSGVTVYPEEMIERCFLQYIFLTALGLVYFILLWTESERKGSKASYTLLRLKITEKQQFAVRTAYNALCLMLVFAVQTALAYIICRLYADRLPPELVSPQYFFLTFYRNRFLHCLLPMAETGKWIKNLLLLLAFGMDAAGGIRDRNYITAICLYIFSARLFAADIGTLDVLFCGIIYALFIAAALLRLFGIVGGKNEED